jgi:hypothetical protein
MEKDKTDKTEMLAMLARMESLSARSLLEGRGSCLEWVGWRDGREDNRGRISWDGKVWGVARLAWTLLRGEVPEGMYVLHRCDNPRCWNVLEGHLWLGTQSENIRDMDAKGRRAKVRRMDSRTRRRLMEESMAGVIS